MNVDAVARDYPRSFGPVKFAVPGFEQINAAAYWDYQRAKVYVRSSDRLRRISLARLRLRKPVKPDKVIQVKEMRPPCCARCGETVIYKNGRLARTVHDLRFSATGVRRCITRYLFNRYQCWSCKAGFKELPRLPKYGRDLKAFVAYQLIELRIAQRALTRHFETVFGIDVPKQSMNQIKSSLANDYAATYGAVLRRIAAGGLVHADETRVIVEGVHRYVWVFTNLEEVAYMYGESREAATVHEVLGDFRGILVSDFYTAYDGLPCGQQKCLIHLMRDLNEDVRKQPFNDEMKEIAYTFGALIRPIIETIDHFGLKRHHLRKHKVAIARFYDHLSRRQFQTEVAIGYRKRFEKQRERLFTFLDHDGVPWNNNNAEHAIKAFARLRNVIGSNSTPKGIREYLILLSINETCKYKGLNFLSFLRSGETDIRAFCELTSRARISRMRRAQGSRRD